MRTRYSDTSAGSGARNTALLVALVLRVWSLRGVYSKPPNHSLRHRILVVFFSSLCPGEFKKKSDWRGQSGIDMELLHSDEPIGLSTE